MEPGDCWLNRESVQSAAHGGPVCGRLRLAPAIRKILDYLLKKGRSNAQGFSKATHPGGIESNEPVIWVDQGQEERSETRRKSSRRSAVSIFDLFRNAAKEWSQDQCPQLGAALVYYTVFSLAPLMLVLLAVFGLIYGGNEPAREKILDQLRYLLDPSALKVIQEIAKNAAQPIGTERVTALPKKAYAPSSAVQVVSLRCQDPVRYRKKSITALKTSSRARDPKTLNAPSFKTMAVRAATGKPNA
jgi:hypothetical protein